MSQAGGKIASHRLKHNLNTNQFHAAVKDDAALWDRLVIPIGTMADADGGVLALGNCRVCMSTLARPVVTR